MFVQNKANGDNRSFMYYNGEYYINGTEVVLSDKYVTNNVFNGKKIWKYARFDYQTTYYGKRAYFFSAVKLDWLSFREMNLDTNMAKDYAPYFIIETFKVNEIISTITKPIKLSSEETRIVNTAITDMITNPKTDFDNPILLTMWIVYFVVMVGSLIFNQFYIIWIIASYVFFTWRKDILK